MKRVDELVGATVCEVAVGRGGTIHLRFRRINGSWGVSDWDPMVVRIPREPKKRKAKG